jgi:hypothetical protein
VNLKVDVEGMGLNLRKSGLGAAYWTRMYFLLAKRSLLGFTDNHHPMNARKFKINVNGLHYRVRAQPSTLARLGKVEQSRPGRTSQATQTGNAETARSSRRPLFHFQYSSLVLLSQKVAAFADEESSIWQT